MRRAFPGLLALLLAATASAYEPVGYPGSAWGSLSRDLDGIDGSAAQGHVTQGVDWAVTPHGWTFGTYAGYALRARSRNEDYFNAHGPFVGAALSRGPLTFGADFTWQRYPVLRDDTDSPSVFATWYARSDLAPWTGLPRWGESRALAAPFTSWGRVEYDPNYVEGGGSKGWVQQGIDWVVLPGGVTLDTYLAFRWRLRSSNTRYYDMFGPAVGVDLVRGPVDLALEYAWRRYPGLADYSNGPQLALSWYFGWDLRRR